MKSGSIYSWLPVVGLAQIAYLFVRRSRAAELPRRSSSARKNERSGKRFQLIPISFNRDLLGNYLSLFCLLMAVPLGIILLNSIMGYLNPHILIAGFAIWILDRLWQRDVINEPALSRDFRYFINLIWRS